MQWYLSVLKNYVGFSGRARRKEYWMFTLINAIVGAIINVIQLILGDHRIRHRRHAKPRQ